MKQKPQSQHFLEFFVMNKYHEKLFVRYEIRWAWDPSGAWLLFPNHNTYYKRREVIQRTEGEIEPNSED